MPDIYTIEGNVGAGKTTFLKSLQETCGSGIVVLFEPVDEWMSFKPKGGDKSIFELFYEDRKKYGFVFQMMALQSRFEFLQKTMEENKDKIIVCERSFLTDCEIFAKLNNDEGNISDVEFAVYKKWHEFFMQVLKPNIKGLVYLRVEPDICKERIIKRSRQGEESFSEDYLRKLHDYHEAWLMGQTYPVLKVDGSGIPDMNVVLGFISANREDSTVSP